MAVDDHRARRKPRADGERNRAAILEAAHRILSEKGSGASLDEIAQAAGVGNGTLYRHFPTRTALVEAVCRNDTQDLIDAATSLAASVPPLVALAHWMDMFIDYIATKKIIAEAVSTLVTPASDLHGSSGADVRPALTTLFDRARDDGSITIEFDPLDLLRAVTGVATVGAGPDWERNARQVVRVLIAGFQGAKPLP